MAVNGQNVNKLLLVAVSALTGVSLTGAGMVLRGDFLGGQAAAAVEQRMDEKLDDHKAQEIWVKQLILQDLKEIRHKLDNP
jgi:hypothetical protein